MASLTALATTHLGLQMNRHQALIAAFEEAGAALPRFDWAVPTSWTQRDAARAPSDEHAVLAFLRGPPLRLSDGSAETLASYDKKSLESLIKHGASLAWCR